MRKHSKIIIFFLFISCTSAFASDEADKSLKELDSYIDQRDHYIQLRENRINILKQRIASINNDTERFEIYSSLFDEYKSYKYDSAFVYAQKSFATAQKLSDLNKVIEAKRQMAFCYLSSGLFKEASDIMKSIDIENAPTNIKRDYYVLLARLYYDMADYSFGEYFSQDYIKSGIQYCDSAITYLPIESSSVWSTVGLKRMQQRNFPAAIDAFQTLLRLPNIDDHTYAIATSSIGFMYSEMGDTEKAIYYLSQASIGDIKSATKEAVALQNLAGILYREGDVKRANSYIRIAMEDANFYNARHRKIQISAILPIIEKERMEMVERQRNDLIIFASIVSLLFFLLLAATVIIYKQVKRLRKARQTIQLQNKDLKSAYIKLYEANEIKDEYIVQSLYGKSEYIDRLENLYKIINRKIIARQYDDIRSYLKEDDLKKERENMYSSFDDTFLRLFPDFIEGYNHLFKPEDSIGLDTNKVLTPELRIFALIRLGIHESERIAKFLDYSVNTINTYKTKVKNKSIIPNEQFEQKIMEIKTVRTAPLQ
ncbi:MAG: tetratricopeptide repeat protein [Prevotella sp.]|jgi:tetratricopeptide (TPR) repeat protein|nr:tetratricopeptide repeat protein [Prevotella sp.]